MKFLRKNTVLFFRLFTAIIMLAISVSTPAYTFAQSAAPQAPTVTSTDNSFAVTAEPPNFAYQTDYSTGWLDEGTDVTVDADGNAYVISQSYTNDHDVYVLKLDPDGAVIFNVPLAGSDLDYGTGIALDGEGGVYVAGWTDSPDFPLVNPLQDTLVGFRDAFVARLSAADGAILYSTYLGGNYVDQAEDIVLGPSGEIYLIGKTESSDFPTVDPYQGELNGPAYQYSDAFITRLSADGSQILYSTYLGGTNDDEGQSIAVGTGGEIYIAGDTKSSDFPLQSPLQAFFAGGERDIFVSRLSPDGSVLQFSTYLGGEDWDQLGRLALDASGDPVIAGTTRSIAYPTTPGAFQETFVGEILGCEVFFGQDRNCDDIFVSKLASDGSSLSFSTFIGGMRDDVARGIEVGEDGSVYVVGYSNSPDYPPNGIDFSAEIILSRLSPNGSSLEYSVTVDSGSANAGHGVSLGAPGEIYITAGINVPSDTYVAKLVEGDPPPQPVDSLHVENIDLQVQYISGRYVLTTQVLVHDQNGSPVQGANVSVAITNPVDRTKIGSDLTNSFGIAQFRMRHRLPGPWQVCVIGIDMSGYSYDSAQNLETCDQLP